MGICLLIVSSYDFGLTYYRLKAFLCQEETLPCLKYLPSHHKRGSRGTLLRDHTLDRGIAELAPRGQTRRVVRRGVCAEPHEVPGTGPSEGWAT